MKTTWGGGGDRPWKEDDDDIGYKSTNDTIAYVDNDNDKLSDDHR